MDFKSAIFTILTVIAHCSDISAKENYQVVLETYSCKVLDSAIVSNYTCFLTKSLNKTIALRTQELTLQRGIKLYNYYLHMQLFRKLGNEYRPYLINIQQDLCALLSKDRNWKDVSLLRKLLKFEEYAPYGNYYEPCPISGTRYERNAETQANVFLMTGVFRMDVTGYMLTNGIRRNITFSQISGAIRIVS